MNILTALAQNGAIQPADVVVLEKEIASSGVSPEATLLARGIPPEAILEAKGKEMSLPTRLVADGAITPDVLGYIPESSVAHYNIVPLGVADGVLEVGVVDPDNLEALDAVNFIASRAGMPFKVHVILERDFERIVEMYQSLPSEVNRALSELGVGEGGDAPKTAAAGGSEPDMNISADAGGNIQTIKEDAPVTKIVATVLRYAIEGRASDIHIEPMRENVRVRFRVDGVLNTSLVLPASVHPAVIARVKILASIKLDEKRKPQDGRFTTNVGKQHTDFRVSTFPTRFGEKVVMRILGREDSSTAIDAIGLSERNMERIKDALTRPYGMILISGPTGSGKSTTLFTMLKELDREGKNVISLEDPVEYVVSGVAQSQVHPEIGYSFASGLRSVLRQDPDIIMVGEIRDRETAQLAVQAALTGHLVISTIHTNNAVGVIPRLIDMGVDPYLIAPTLVLAVAQRLVRRRCENAGRKIPVEGSVKAMFDAYFADLPEKFRTDIPTSDHVFGIEAAPNCPNGTRGRIGVFELLPMNTEVENTILKNPSEDEIWRIVRTQGMFTMKEDAIIKALEGVIPIEEVNTLGVDIDSVIG